MEAETCSSSQPIRCADVGCFFNNPTYSDITLHVGERKFYAHRLVLCSWSNVFKSILGISTREDTERPTYKLEEDEECCKIFDQFLKFLYREILTISKENVLSVLKLSRKYEISELTQLCENYLGDLQKNVSSATLVHQMATSCMMQSTAKSCLSTIQTNFETITAEELSMLDESTLISLLSSDDRIVVSDEFKLFEKLVPWLNRCTEQDVMVKFMKCIKFIFMSSQQLRRVASFDIMRRMQRIDPNFLSDALEQRALYYEYFDDVLPSPVPHPRFYLNMQEGVFGQFPENMKEVDDLGFASLGLGSGECIDNVLIGDMIKKNDKSENRSEHFSYDEHSRWNLEIKELSKICDDGTKMWGVHISISQYGAFISTFNGMETNEKLDGQVVEAAIEIKLENYRSIFFTGKETWISANRNFPDAEVFSFETPCTYSALQNS